MNGKNLLGRTFDDVLLELFYYELEKKLPKIEGDSSRKWPKLLIGSKSDENRCVLRYFTSSTGGFNISSNCYEGGNPVCQFPPISIKINVWEGTTAKVRDRENIINKIGSDDGNSTIHPTTIPVVGHNTSSTDDGNGTIHSTTIAVVVHTTSSIDDASSTLAGNLTASSAQKLGSKDMVTTVVMVIFSLTVLGGIIFLVYYLRRRRGRFCLNNPNNRADYQTEDTSTVLLEKKASNSTTALYNRLENTESTVLIDPDLIKSSNGNSHAIIEVSKES